MSEADKTCRLLTQITGFPVSIEDLRSILDQRLVENEAHERYQNTRTKLFEAAKWN
jgi:hypothetical protein